MKEMRNNKASNTRRSTQSGQAIVIIALVMVGMLGALGLAIDGGGLMFLYRDIQNATDAAVVAATYARCTNATPAGVISAGMQAAADNGFNNDGVTNWVTVSNPPPAGSQRAGNIDYVEVTIRAHKPSYFIQLVYPQALEVTNGSTGHCRPPFNPTEVGAVFGISTTCDQPATVNFQGADLQIIGGVHSNRDLKFNGSDQVVDGAGTYVGGAQGGATFTGGTSRVTTRPDPLTSYFARNVFDAGGRVYERALARSMQLRGDASLIHVINGNLTSSNLEGYYVVSGNVDVKNAVFGPAGATIVANGTVDLHTTLEANYFVDGLLLYSGASGGCNGQGVISFSGPNGNGGGGNGNSNRVCGPGVTPDPTRQLMRGVIYAPNGGINFSVPRANMVGALVAQFVSSSAARSCIWYEPSILDPIPPQVEMAQ
jgi:hypothetical protein